MIAASDLTQDVLVELHDQAMDADDSLTAARCILAIRHLAAHGEHDGEDAAHLTGHLNSIGAITRLQLLPYAETYVLHEAALPIAEHLGDREFTTIGELLADVDIPAQARVVIATDLVLSQDTGALAKSGELYAQVLALL